MRSTVKYNNYLGHYVDMGDGSWYAINMLDMISQTFYMQSGKPRFVWNIELHGSWTHDDKRVQ